jgi:hypothetical protein
MARQRAIANQSAARLVAEAFAAAPTVAPAEPLMLPAPVADPMLAQLNGLAALRESQSAAELVVGNAEVRMQNAERRQINANIEHRTLNVQHRSEERRIDVFLYFDVRCWTFDVRCSHLISFCILHSSFCIS